MNQESLRPEFTTQDPHFRPTREMVRHRTIELASLAGRGPLEIKQCDYERAKREVTGETDFDRQQEILNGWKPEERSNYAS